MADYSLIVKNPAGSTKRIITGGRQDGFRSLTYINRINDVGILRFELNEGHLAIDDLTKDAQIEVRRWDERTEFYIERYVDFYGLFRKRDRIAETNKEGKFIAFCPEKKHFLARPIIAWPAGESNRTEFTNIYADAIAKTLVRRNATTALATTGEGRIRTIGDWGDNISVEANASVGGQHDFRCAQRRLLPTLQDIARIGNGDFDLVKTGSQAWEYRWYDGQLGTDRTSTVIFSLDHGNMRNPKITGGGMEERTIAIVGGQGQEDDRTFVVRTGTNYDSEINDIEVFVPAVEYTTTEGLNGVGDIRLDELQARDTLIFETIQVPGSLYGKHYFLGDLVTAQYANVETTKQIESVSITYVDTGSERIESVQIGMKDV